MILLFSCAICGCDCKNKSELLFYAPDGAPALSIVKFINENENFDTGEKISYHIVQSNMVSSAITTNEADFVILPLNLATKLYNNDKEKYTMIAVITHGNFYFVSKKEISKKDDLIGKTILISQTENSIPDVTLKMWLKNDSGPYTNTDEGDGLKVNLIYNGNARNVMGKLTGDEKNIGLLPEPAVTTFLSTDGEYKRSNFTEFPQAVLLVKNSIIET